MSDCHVIVGWGRRGSDEHSGPWSKALKFWGGAETVALESELTTSYRSGARVRQSPTLYRFNITADNWFNVTDDDRF